MGVKTVTSLRYDGLYNFPDPVPQTWIQIPALDTTYIVYFVGMWGDNHGSAVGWSFCFYVPILIRFTSKKFVYIIKKA